MEQRRLRLGDILDDYCPRERRVTNHAVVAMIEEDVKQTRCTTCDAEHAYKGARVPTRRKKETPSALFKEVLAGMPELDDVPLLAAAPAPPTVPPDAVPAITGADADQPISDSRATSAADASSSDDDEIAAVSQGEGDALDSEAGDPPADGPVHRPLIRATLPRVEGQKEARPVTDFTIRQMPPRGNGNGHGSFRSDRDRMRMRAGGGNGNGSGFGHGNANRPGGQRSQTNRPAGGGRQRAGGAASGFRNGNGNGNKRGRGSRG